MLGISVGDWRGTTASPHPSPRTERGPLTVGRRSSGESAYWMIVPQSTNAKLVSTRKWDWVEWRSAWKSSMG